MPKKLPRLASRFPALPAAAAAALLGVSLVPAAAHADASCKALLAAKISEMQAKGDAGIIYDLTRVGAGPNANVGYQQGIFVTDGSNLRDESVGSNWLQSDRVGHGRPFDASRGDGINVYVTADGNLWIWSRNNNDWVLLAGNLSCSGNSMTGAANGSIYTLAFRQVEPPIP